MLVSKFEKLTTKNQTPIWNGRVLSNRNITRVVTMTCFEEELGVELIELGIHQMVAVTSTICNFTSNLEKENQIKTTRSSKVDISFSIG